MTTTTATTEETPQLSNRDLQKHMIRTFVGSLITSLLFAIGVGISFYYKQTYSMQAIQEKQVEMAITLEKHTDLINKATQNAGMSDVQMQAYSERLKTIEESQKQIISILLEIKQKNN